MLALQLEFLFISTEAQETWKQVFRSLAGRCVSNICLVTMQTLSV